MRTRRGATLLGLVLAAGCGGEENGPPAAPDPAERIPGVTAELERHYDLFAPDALAARVKRIRPHVEAVLGGSLGGPVPVVRLSRDMAARREVRREVEESGETDPEKRRAIELRARIAAWNSFRTTLGMLGESGEDFLLLPDNFLDYPEEDRGALLDVVIAHELVHVYQARRFGLRANYDETDDERQDAHAAALEGHAEFVSREVAKRLGLDDAFETLADHSGVDPSRHGPGFLRNRFRYRAGERFFAAVAESVGGHQAAAERIFANRPASHWQIQNPTRYLAGERHGADLDLRPAARALGGESAESTGVLPGLFRPQAGDAAAGVLRAGRIDASVARGALRGRSVLVYVARCASPAAARAFRDALARRARVEADRTVYPDFALEVYRSRVREDEDGVLHIQRSVRLGLVGRGEMHVVVRTRGDLVVQVLTHGTRPTAPFLKRLAGRVLHDLAGTRPEPGTAEARVRALLEREPGEFAPGELRALLDDADAEVRAAAANHVPPTDSEAARRFLERACRHEDPNVRARALVRLGEHGAAAEALSDPDARVRRAAVATLNRDWFETASREQLLGLLEDEDAQVRVATLAVLQEVERDAPLIGRLIRDPDQRVRAAAWGSAGKDLLDYAVTKGIDDPDQRVRAQVVTFLSTKGLASDDPRVLEALARSLEDVNPVVMIGLLSRPGSKLKAVLPRLLEALDDETTRIFVIPAIAEVDTPRAKGSLATMATAPGHRSDVAEALAGYEPARELLRVLLRDWDPAVRLAAARSLRELGEDRQDIVALAIELLRSSPTRYEAASALEEAAKNGQLGEHAERAKDSLLRALDARMRNAGWIVDALREFPLTRGELDRILGRLATGDDSLVESIAEGIEEKWAARAADAVPALVAALEREEDVDFFADDCLDALAAIGPEAKAALPVIRRFLEHERAWTRGKAEEAIEAIEGTAAK